MKNNRSLLIFGIVSLLFLTIACKFSLSPIEVSNELGDGEIALTNQVKLQTSVAQTVEVMKPSEVPEDPGPAKEESALAGLVAGTPLPCNKPKFQGETIPDNSEFDPGDSFTKTWTVLNDGTCSWTTNYRLVFVDGDQMGGPSMKSFSKTTNPGETITLSADLTAPGSDGTYTGTWKIEADDGEKFGDYWITIIVGEPDESGSAFSVTGISFDGSDQMKVGFCPHAFNLLAKITVDGKGTVKYHWLISNGYTGTIESVEFDGVGTKTVTLSKNLSCSSTSTCSYVVELYIDSPNPQKFGAWPIVIHCM